MQKLQNVSDILIYVKVFLKELPKEKNDYPLELNTDIRCCEPHSGIDYRGKNRTNILVWWSTQIQGTLLLGNADGERNRSVTSRKNARPGIDMRVFYSGWRKTSCKQNRKLITRACRVKEGYCVDLRIFLTVEPLLAAYKITMFFCLRLVGVP